MNRPANDNGEDLYCPRCDRIGHVDGVSAQVSFGFRLNGHRPPICIRCNVEARFLVGF
jgi:hypothetical protein